jgi:2-haloacid dehalogenase
MGAAGVAALWSAGCGAPALRATVPSARRAIAAVAFDLFTIFDPRSVDAHVEQWAPGSGARLAAAWRTRAFEQTWIRAAAGQYRSFRHILEDALEDTARADGRALARQERRALADAFHELDPWPDAADALESMRAAGLRLATLANFTPSMISALLSRSRFDGFFEALLSTDAARTFKPDPRAYHLAVGALSLPADRIAFAAFGPFDAAGATWFGYPTFWVDRLGSARDRLGVDPPRGRDLVALRTWIEARNA